MTNLWGSLLRRGMRIGFDRGVMGGSPLWLVLGGLALLGHLAGRAMTREVELVFRSDLERGDAYEISQADR